MRKETLLAYFGSKSFRIAKRWRDLPPCYNGKHESPPGSRVTDNSTLWLWADANNSLSVQGFRPGGSTTPNEIVID